MAEAKRYEVGTQLSETASMANSFPIAGRAILIEDPIKGVRKEAMVATSNTTFLLTLNPAAQVLLTKQGILTCVENLRHVVEG